MSNTYGNNLKLQIYGGSHDEKIGVRLSGLPADEAIDIEHLQKFMSRRAPGQNKYSTKRREPDIPVFLSGISNGRTTGEALHAVIYNTNQHSGDYADINDIPRPSHADFAAVQKYGKDVDLRGGGRFSGRLTAPMCIAGGICLQILERHNISIRAKISSVGKVKDTRGFDPLDGSGTLCPDFPTIDHDRAMEMQDEIDQARLHADSVGGIIECVITGIDAGRGEHMFDGIEGRISSILFSIPAVKGVEFGLGFDSSRILGSENNDPYYTDGKTVYTKTNNSGGIVGGMSNGMPIIFRVAFKPTPSIGKEQDSVSLSKMENVKLQIHGRHDPCVVPRAVPVVEAAAAIAILDILSDKEEEK